MKKKFLLSTIDSGQTVSEEIVYDYDFTKAINWLWSKIGKPINLDILCYYYLYRDEELPGYQEETLDYIRQQFEGRVLKRLRKGDSYDFSDYNRTKYQIEEIAES